MLYGAIVFLGCAALSSAGYLWSARWLTDTERAAEERLFRGCGGRRPAH